MKNLADKMDLQMVTMSEHLKGYLLNPSNTNEAKAKAAADDQFAEYSKELALLCDQHLDLKMMQNKIATYDAKVLDSLENQVLAMIEKHDPNAGKFYDTEYSKARAIQNENFLTFKVMIDKFVKNELLLASERKKSSTLMLLILLWLSAVAGLGIMSVVVLTTLKKANQEFKNLLQVSSQLGQASETLFSNSNSLSECVAEQSSAIQKMAASLSQVSEAVKLNYQSSDESKNLSANSKENVKQGQQTVSQMLHAIKDISQINADIIKQVDEGNQKVSEIVQVISEIEGKTKIINDIVFQTKLLSFNASVEAARAGEHGKGFAVVAEEVGNLAQMSGNAAKEISTMLEASIQKVESIVNSSKSKIESLVESAKQTAKSGMQTAEVCSDSLNKILNSAEQVDNVIMKISLASHAQVKDIDEINLTMQHLGQTTERNNKAAKESANSSNYLNKEAQEIKSLVDSLFVLFQGHGNNKV